ENSAGRYPRGAARRPPPFSAGPALPAASHSLRRNHHRSCRAARAAGRVPTATARCATARLADAPARWRRGGPAAAARVSRLEDYRALDVFG
nr:hypothetical protein [Tanacetum cinerariifolium]